MTLQDMYDKFDDKHTPFCDPPKNKKKHSWQIYTPDPFSFAYKCENCSAEGTLKVQLQ